MSPRLEFRVLGPLEASRDGQPVELGAHRQRALLAELLVHADEVVPRERLVEELWGEDAPPSASNMIQVYVSRLRKVLGPDVLMTRPPGYLLRLGDAQLDSIRLASLVVRAREAMANAQAREALVVLAEALGLWRGLPLADFTYDAFAQGEVTRLEELRLEAIELRIEAELALGRHVRLVGELEQLIALHPYRERLRGQLMLVLYRSGRQAEALEAYRTARKTLADELGIEPSPALRELEQAILTQDRKLGSAAAAPELGRAIAEPAAGSRPAAPAGTVTFLFTDVEESSRAWEEHPALMRAALHRYDELVREAVTGPDGYVFKRVGYAFGIAFSEAGAAIAAAVEGQRRLSAEDWPTAAPLVVRMALHSGSSEEHDGDYFGPTVNRTAQLLSLAGGGQVLVSATTTALAADALAVGVSLRDLGEHLLRDIGWRERVAQVVADGMRADFQPLPTVDGTEVAHNLPAQLTRFVGREVELAELRAALRAAHVVTLVGPGGVGKSRLALEAAAREVGLWKDGVWFVELASVSEEGSIGRAIAAALGVRERADWSGVEAVIDVLRSYETLLILDNCEHLIEGAAKAADAIARACPGVTVVTTSRERLALEGEHVIRVAPLEVPDPDDHDASKLRQYDSISLFLDRAKVHDPTVVADPASLADIARICRRLDGVPLALELAAARIRGLGPQGLEKRLNDRFRLLRGGTRGRQPRQRTLAATLDWSFDLLSVPERLVFNRLAVFAGTFDLDAAQWVCGGDGIDRGDVWELLTSLVDKSLVEVDTVRRRIRYRLLETMREYGREHLLAVPDATIALRNRHLEHYLMIAEASDRLFTSRAGREVGVCLTADGENFDAALITSGELRLTESGQKLAVALADFWRARGLHRKTVTWLTSLFERSPPAPRPALQGRALFAVGRSLMHLSRLPEAAARLEEGLAIARAQNDDTLACQTLGMRAFVAYLERDTRALALANETLAAAKRVGEPALVAIALARMADASQTLDPARARDLFERALDTARRADDEVILGEVLNNSGEDARQAGDFDLARERLEECVALAEARDDRYLLAFAKRNLAAVLLRQGETDGAIPLAHDALLLAERSGSPLQIGYAVLTQADVASSAGELDRAAFLQGAADALFAEAGTSPELVDATMRDESQAALRATMGEGFDREYESGRTSRRETALGFARELVRVTHSVPITG
jgi:predicted ATPase/DNA-binding SARP family transcriptional activator